VRRLNVRSQGLATAVALAAVASCSVINSYDDVVPAKHDGGSSGSAGAGAGGTAQQGGEPGSGAQGPGQAGTPSDVGGEGGGAGAPPAAPTTGLLVLGAKSADGSEDLLLTLNPESGAELSRESLPGAAVVGAAYDGAPGKNLWFIFTASDFPADSSSKADLQVRRYVDETDEWVTIKKVSALPPPRPRSFVLLNDRLAYLSYGLVEGTLQDTVTILDTTDPEGVKEVMVDATFTGRMLGMVGTRGAPGDMAALGGSLAVATGGGCNNLDGPSLSCQALNLTPIFVGDTVTAGVAQGFRGFLGHPAFASSVTSQLAYVALPAQAAGNNVDVIRFDPRDVMLAEPLVPPTPAKALAGLALADCLDVTVLGVVSDKTLWATSEQGTSVKAILGQAPHDVVYEPFTSSIIAPFNPDSPLYPDNGAGGAGPGAALPAFTVGKTGITTSLTPRATADWAPPDVAVNVVAARFPIPFTCP
jgi:hypothetical protein